MIDEYKGYKIVSEEPFMMKVIRPIGKGSVNKSLRGRYTTFKDASLAIDKFLGSQEETNGKKTQPD